jgi:hypothetical protein
MDRRFKSGKYSHKDNFMAPGGLVNALLNNRKVWSLICWLRSMVLLE